ncbi:MAG: DeoR family transcriptional regulator [bacterium]|nr:DeoR family transcriptional regulator [bacterium]
MLFNFTQKAYEICYVVFRLGDGIKNADLRTRLEKAGLDLLEAGSSNNNLSLSNSLSLLEVLMNFSQGIGEISYLQSQVLLREIGNLNTAVRQNNSAIAELNLEEFFQTSTPTQNNNESIAKSAMPMVVDNKVDEIGQEEAAVVEKDKENAVMRKSAIIDIMRQVQNCRIKDLVAAFPCTSERTLRYDLQKFCEEGMIERVGPGGPGTYYQLKPAVTFSQ